MDQSIKKPWQSKTIILNAIFGLLAFACVFFPQASIIKPFLDSHANEISMVWAMLNVVLRAVSKDKISLGD